MAKINYNTNYDGSYNIIGEQFYIQAYTLCPAIIGKPAVSLDFKFTGSEKGKLAGAEGNIIHEEAECRDFTILREVYSSFDNKILGIRITITNTGNLPFNLENIVPMSIKGSGFITAADASYDSWHILRAARHKNDVPGCYRPGINDDDFEDANLKSEEIPAGFGVSAEDKAKFTKIGLPIVADPFIYIKNRTDYSIPGLFIGVLGQHEHLHNIMITGTEDQRNLVRFDMICDFDGVVIDPGETRNTHWLLLWEDISEKASIDRFAGMLKDLYNFTTSRKPAPAIYCSWYFYGANFNEKELNENLAELRKSPIPFDIFLIDDCWSDKFGSWNANKKFPSGMKEIADRISKAGFIPGIWTCPFVVMADSQIVKEHPEVIAKDKNGKPYIFGYQGPKCYAVDPTSAYAETYFNELYGKLNKWGFKFHKFDFLRSIVTNSGICFANNKMTRAQAYRHGLSLIRKAIGDDGYILACGGLFEGSIGLADGMRVGSDTSGSWKNDTYLRTMKQNFFRSHLNHFWQTDPDAAMLRLNAKEYNPQDPTHAFISLGSFTDEEAFAVVANQYLGGGMMCFSERIPDFIPERKAMLRHIIPVGASVPEILDIWNPGCPELFLSNVKPKCKELGEWWTLAVGNWSKETKPRIIEISELNLPVNQEKWTVFEFYTQTFLGIKSKNDTISIEVPTHGMRLLRIAPYDGKTPMILGTDLHLTGGGVELKNVSIKENSISGEIETEWDYPVNITVGFPTANGMSVKVVTVVAGNRSFNITN